MAAPTDAEKSCLLRLTEMAAALEKMAQELPDDVLPLGERARDRVRLWQGKLAQGGADLEELSAAMREISSWMDALTARLVLVPWDRPSRNRLPN